MRFDALFFITLGVVVFVATPFFFLLYSLTSVPSELWIRLYETRLKEILPNTLKLMVSVGFLTALIGTTTAWIVTRYKFFGKGLWDWALILPLSVPGYILAYAYGSVFAPGGPFQSLWKALFGDLIEPPSIYNFWGVSIILSLVNYPYVYILARASFLSQNVTYEEVAKTLGVNSFARFWHINLRMAYPGIWAGVVLALMEVMADFGTVAMLRYPTFTEAIYRQMTGRFDPIGATALSSVLVLLSFILLNLQRYFKGKSSFEQTRGKYRVSKGIPVSPVRALFFNLYILSVLGFAFLLPVSMLVFWSVETILMGALDSRFIRFTFNTLLVAGLASLIATILAFPIAYMHSKRQSILSKLFFYVSNFGYSLPGPVVAVSLLLIATSLFPGLYSGLLLLVIAYVVRFAPVSIQSQDSAMATVSKSVEDATKVLGSSLWDRFIRVFIPLIKPGILAGATIVFVDAMKELPATLLLRPIGFDTLSVRVWVEATEGFWKMASPSALLIVLVGLIPIALIVKRQRSVL